MTSIIKQKPIQRDYQLGTYPYDSTPFLTSSFSQNVTEDSIYSDSDYDNNVILLLTEFEDEILNLVQGQCDPLIKKDEYTIIYKQSSLYGMETLLNTDIEIDDDAGSKKKVAKSNNMIPKENNMNEKNSKKLLL
ncbi:hypothetical protein GLOIN_2v1772564 [Rhizophagus clarus]|uniref:Uncharacterized protein n=1 Tax=Rhizophagus clarus TaxID=94130 RepID=A0A8H3LMA0_9GLOM|nr:hypothetical protein GLOIN_2v1772564 [Rhizophagus clarus]